VQEKSKVGSKDSDAGGIFTGVPAYPFISIDSVPKSCSLPSLDAKKIRFRVSYHISGHGALWQTQQPLDGIIRPYTGANLHDGIFLLNIRVDSIVLWYSSLISKIPGNSLKEPLSRLHTHTHSLSLSYYFGV
jgi:hypothetical protein